MKYLFSFLLFMISQSASAQMEFAKLPKDSITGKITYSEVFLIDSVSKEELYSRAMEWYANSFNSSKAVIEYSDKVEGKIIGKGAFVEYLKAVYTFPGDTRFTISTYFKDGKAKITLTNFSFEVRNEKTVEILYFDNPSKQWNTWYPKQILKINEQMNIDALSTIESFKKTLQQKAITEKW